MPTTDEDDSICRQIANPRRTTLAHLKDASELSGPAAAGSAQETASETRALPQRTANPRRTVLNELPKGPRRPLTGTPHPGGRRLTWDYPGESQRARPLG